jgi:PAS domain S-box-containing protein
MPQREIELILLRQWASHMTLPIWVTGLDGDLVYYNEPAEAMLGVRYDEAGEMPVGDLIRTFQITDESGTPLSSEAFPLAVVMQTGKPHHGRMRYCGLDGTWRTVEVTAFPFEGEGRRPLGVVAIWWEATDA